VLRGTPAWALAAMALVSVGALSFVWTRPSGPRARTAADERAPLPDVDARPADEILGDDGEGLPR
jgi:hypothetical protein